MIMLGIFVLLPLPLIVPSLGLPFLSSSLVFMHLYLWSRENPNANTSIMGFVTLKALCVLLDLGHDGRHGDDGRLRPPRFPRRHRGAPLLFPHRPATARRGTPRHLHPGVGPRGVSTPSEMRAPGAAAAPACIGDPPHARSPREEGADSAASSAATDESQPRVVR